MDSKILPLCSGGLDSLSVELHRGADMVVHGISAGNINVSAFVTSLLSPVLRNMVCGNFRESIDRQLILNDVDKDNFMRLLQLGCGDKICEASNFETILQLAELSERLQMNAVTTMLEDRLIEASKAETCVEMLARAEASGLKRLEDACREVTYKHCIEIWKTEALLQLSEETMERLLEEDELGTGREEDVFEAVVRWMRRDDKELQGEGLLRKIRFGVIEDAYLAESMVEALPGHDVLKQLVAEAMVNKGKEEWERKWDGVERLCEKWLVPRGLKEKILGSGLLKSPKFVTLDRQGRVLVSDFELHQVVAFNYDGSVAQCIGSRGKGDGQFECPTGIAVDREGNILVADCGNHRIQMFQSDGSFVRCFSSYGSAAGQLSHPEGVAIDLEGHVVVADRGNHRIQGFHPDGSVAFHFTSERMATGLLPEPCGVAVDGAGRMAVLEYHNHEVQVCDRDGAVSLRFGRYGDGPGQLKHPMGVAVDRENRLVVADCDNHRIQVFDADGSVAKIIGREGSGVGEFSAPMGVAVDAAGRILVVDCGNGRVQVL